MWLFTAFGFFSVIQKKGDDVLTIRGRARSDLLRLRRFYLPQLSEPVAHEGTDYPWRARCRHDDLAQAMTSIIRHMNYANFKDEVALSLGKSRAQRYAKVWQAMYGMDDDLPEPLHLGFEGLPWSAGPASGKKRAFGGVVVDPVGRLLLREVANHFDGYVWTYAKGRPDEGESPRETALREVQEEMGVQANILLPLPSTFAGGTTDSQFFLMVVDPRTVDLSFQCDETAALCWALPHEAQRLIAQTTNPMGRERDLRILDEVQRFMPSSSPLQLPIARKEDWACRPLPAKRTVLTYERTLTPMETAKLVRGWLSQSMEEKWFIYFEDGVLHIHRSWTGYEIFRVHLSPEVDKPGHWSVKLVEFNRHPDQTGLTQEDAVLTLHNVIDLMIQT